MSRALRLSESNACDAAGTTANADRLQYRVVMERSDAGRKLHREAKWGNFGEHFRNGLHG